MWYAVKWEKAYYGLPGLGWIIEMVAYDVSGNVVFLDGADFDTSTSRDQPLSLREAQEPRRGAGAAALDRTRRPCREGSDARPVSGRGGIRTHG